MIVQAGFKPLDTMDEAIAAALEAGARLTALHLCGNMMGRRASAALTKAVRATRKRDCAHGRVAERVIVCPAVRA